MKASVKLVSLILGVWALSACSKHGQERILQQDSAELNNSNSVKQSDTKTVSTELVQQTAKHLSLGKLEFIANKANAKRNENGDIQVQLKTKKGSAVVLKPKGEGVWDLSNYHALRITLTNTSKERITPSVVLTSAQSDKWQFVDSSLYIEPQETKSFDVHFLITAKNFSERYPQYKKMNAGPTTIMSSWKGIDLATVNKIKFAVVTPKDKQPKQASYTINHIEVLGKSDLFNLDNHSEFPFVDEFGQHLQANYPGKLVNASQWQAREQQELQDLKQHQGADNRSKWGGWLKGPRQTPSGYFTTKKIDGKWWFVDPDGYLFWSHGVTGVGHKGASTQIAGREHYFSGLPSKFGNYSSFYHGDRFDFTMSNLYKKYGDNWQEITTKRNHQRLKSWGMNTYGNWSQPENSSSEKTPFTVAVHYKSVMLEEKFPDPWDKNFATQIRRSLEQKRLTEQADSPWNIGFFIDNELHFFQDWSYAKIITSAKPTQPAKQYFVKALEKKYLEIAELNKAWKTTFTAFDDILNNQEPLSHLIIGEDSKWFYKAMVERYYRICSESVKSVYPNHLYLGSRVHGDTNSVVLKASEKYVDVISYNLYRRNLKGFTSRAEQLTKPLMSTEFHFGALDRGVFHTGLQGVSNQEERAEHYYEYVKSALENPLFVGTHWFQYRAQAITGRGDGENYQIGLVDITDTPYPETIKAVRKIGYPMYETRWEGK